jgi:hypothetical protein
MHPLIAAELTRQLVDDRIREARQATRVAPKVITPQRALVRESLLRFTRGEEQA